MALKSKKSVLSDVFGLRENPFKSSQIYNVDNPDVFVPEMYGERPLFPPEVPRRSVLVLGGQTTGAAAPPEIASACVRLAEEAEIALLGVDFVAGPEGPWTFAGATPHPDLRLGGEPLLDLLEGPVQVQGLLFAPGPLPKPGPQRVHAGESSAHAPAHQPRQRAVGAPAGQDVLGHGLQQVPRRDVRPRRDLRSHRGADRGRPPAHPRPSAQP